MINLDSIKKLREQTNCSIAECKKAIEQAAGDLNKAKEVLRKKGAQIAEKKAAREIKQGLVEAYIHNGKIGVLLQLGCESDFVARNKDFKELAHDLAMQIASMGPKDIKELLKQPFIKNPEQPVADLINQCIAQFGENIKIEKFVRYQI